MLASSYSPAFSFDRAALSEWPDQSDSAAPAHLLKAEYEEPPTSASPSSGYSSPQFDAAAPAPGQFDFSPSSYGFVGAQQFELPASRRPAPVQTRFVESELAPQSVQVSSVASHHHQLASNSSRGSETSLEEVSGDRLAAPFSAAGHAEQSSTQTLSKRERNNLSATQYRKRRKEYYASLESRLNEQIEANRALRHQTDFLKGIIIRERERQLKQTNEQRSAVNGIASGADGIEQASTALFVMFSSFLMFSPSRVPDLAQLSEGISAIPRSAQAVNFLSSAVYQPLVDMFGPTVVRAALSGIASHFANQAEDIPVHQHKRFKAAF